MSNTIKVSNKIKDELERIKVDKTRRIDLSDFDDLETTNNKKEK
jgi:hypothetical protein